MHASMSNDLHLILAKNLQQISHLFPAPDQTNATHPSPHKPTTQSIAIVTPACTFPPHTCIHPCTHAPTFQIQQTVAYLTIWNILTTARLAFIEILYPSNHTSLRDEIQTLKVQTSRLRIIGLSDRF